MKTPALEYLNKFITDLLLYLKEIAQQVFSCEFYKMFMNPIFPENLLMAASRFIIHNSLFIFATHW